MISRPVSITIALTRMTAEPWREAIGEACTEFGIDADVQLWNGAPVNARYAAVWLPPAQFFEQERDLRVLFNVGAGVEGLLALLDEGPLALLDEGHLAGAVLDVFRTEPLPGAHPFWHHPKVTVTPHLSGPTPRRPAARQIAEAIVQLERGAPVSSLTGFVDRARGY